MHYKCTHLLDDQVLLSGLARALGCGCSAAAAPWRASGALLGVFWVSGFSLLRDLYWGMRVLGLAVLYCAAQVYYKCTDLLDDQVLLSGLAAGALSQVPRRDWRSASLATLLAQEQGLFGLKPEVRACCSLTAVAMVSWGVGAALCKLSSCAQSITSP